MNKLSYVILFLVSCLTLNCSPNLQPKLTNKTWYYISDLSKNNVTIYQDSTLNSEVLRGQQSIVMLDNGILLETATNANDKTQMEKGNWKLSKKTLTLALPSNQKTYTFKVLDISKNKLELELSK